MADGLETVSVTQAHAELKFGKAALIDVRRPDEWQSTGYPEGALLLTMGEPGFFERISEIAQNDSSARLLITCRTGARSGSVQGVLTQMGYTNVVNVRGGFIGTATDPGWTQAGLPVAQYDGD
jgi:rhodanese-related sulfurtransferase